MNTPAVVVVGSVNMDVTATVERIPGPGETLLGTSLSRSGGGKGANQAVAAARAGAVATVFIGNVGRDADGDALRRALDDAGVVTQHLGTVDAPTGTALITVDAAAENSIVVIAGANALLGAPTPDQVAAIGAADVVLAQLEVPADAVLAAARCRRQGALFILNAAPSAPLSDEMWAETDVLVVNEHEAADLSGVGEVELALAALLRRVPAVVVTLGAEGAILARSDGSRLQVPSPKVNAVDTTGAGDTFCGVLAAALAQGSDDLTALRLAASAASLAVERPGAQDAVPTADEAAARCGAAYLSGAYPSDAHPNGPAPETSDR